MRFNRDLRGWGIMDECETEKKDISRKKKKDRIAFFLEKSFCLPVEMGPNP